MRKSKLLVAAVAAVLLAAVIVASAASAAFVLTATECTSAAPTINTLCYSTTEKGTTLFEFSGSEAFLATKEAGTTSFLKAKFGAEEVFIDCTGAEALGGEMLQPSPLVETPKVDVASLDFTGCVLLEPIGKKCVVPAELTTKPIVGGTTGEDGDVLFAPTEGTVFIEIPFTNNGAETCPAIIKGVKKVTGEQLCTLLNTTEDLKLHTLECPASGSKLKLGENVAEFLLSLDVELDNATTDPWSLDLA
jgi:hypothetical protein